MTQKALADASGVRPATISVIEAGDVTPHVRTIVKLASALGMTTQELDERLNAPSGEHRVGA
jgi:DNA-binding XRE family transcriptional regulator